jgi:DNA-binding phage protein
MTTQPHPLAVRIKLSGMSAYRVARLAGISRGVLYAALKGTREMPKAYPAKIETVLSGRARA